MKRFFYNVTAITMVFFSLSCEEIPFLNSSDKTTTVRADGDDRSSRHSDDEGGSESGGVSQGNGIQSYVLTAPLSDASGVGIYDGDESDGFRIGELVQIDSDGNLSRVFDEFPEDNKITELLKSEGVIYLKFQKELPLRTEGEVKLCSAVYFELKEDEKVFPAFCIEGKELRKPMIMRYGLVGGTRGASSERETNFATNGNLTNFGMSYMDLHVGREGVLTPSGEYIWLQDWGGFRSHYLGTKVPSFSRYRVEGPGRNFGIFEFGSEILLSKSIDKAGKLTLETFNRVSVKKRTYELDIPEYSHGWITGLAAVGDHFYFSVGRTIVGYQSIYSFSPEEGFQKVFDEKIFLDDWKIVYVSGYRFDAVVDRANLGRVFLFYQDGTVRLLDEEVFGSMGFSKVELIGNIGFKVSGMDGLTQKSYTVLPLGDENGNIIVDQRERSPRVRSLVPLL